MTFWIVALALAAAVASFLALAFLRGREGAVAAAAYDLRVYRDQLAEVEKDVARGILAPDEAERARTEIARRVLEADRALAGSAAGTSMGAPRGVTLAAGAAAAALVVAGSAWLYARIGAPGYPDLPIATRLALAEEARATRPRQAEAEAQVPARPPAEADPDYLALIERLRGTVAERPGDLQGLALLARNEAALGNFAAAHAAQARLVEVKGEAATAADWTALADLLILAAGGYVSPEAEAALENALARDPTDGTARYYSGLMFAQTGRPDLAFRSWRALLAEGPADAPWIAPIRAQIEDVAARAGETNFRLPPAGPADAAAPGPSEEDIAAAEAMDPEARAGMIRGMVEGLAARLAAEGGPAGDWARLIRAYGVLGETARIAPVVDEARQVFAGDAAALAEIEAAARDAGLAE